MRFFKGSKAASTTEMGLMVGLIAVAIIVAVGNTGEEIKSLFGKVGNGIQGTVPEAQNALNLPNFAAVTDAAVGAVVNSPIQAVGGSGALNVTINNGATFRLCGDAACSSVKQNYASSATVTAGDYIQLQLTAPSSSSQTTNVTLTAGSASSSWSVTTAAELFAFSSHNFTNCNRAGNTGPSLSNCTNAYGGTSWANNTQFFNMSTTGFQEWTVPATGTYRIRAEGAGGAPGNNRAAGRGARMQGDFNLTQGQKITIVVGQTGGSGNNGGGGGGSFVWEGSRGGSPLIVAGGGGGGGFNSSNGLHGTTGTSGTATSQCGNSGGSNGSGGGSMHSAGGGAGWTGNGASSPTYGGTSSSFVGAAGCSGGIGGFGGAGCGHGGDNGGGGGGGYSGGASGCDNGNGHGGGGGGSFNSGTNQSNTIGTNSSHGSVNITKL